MFLHTSFNNIEKKHNIMKQELFKDIPNYEGYYQVSNIGNVKSLSRLKIIKTGSKPYLTKEMMLKKRANPDGYYSVALYVDSERKDFTVHRLVCITFLENPYNLPCVNHKNEVKKDNRVENLEWCTNKYNIRYSSNVNIYQYSLNGVLFKKYLNLYDVDFSIYNKCNIVTCCRGRLKTHRGFVWSYTIISKKEVLDNQVKTLPVYQYTKDLKFIAHYKSAKDTGYKQDCVGAVCIGRRNTYKGFIWSRTKLH